MRIDKERLVGMLHAEGDNDRAEKVAADLPDDIDTDRDAAALEGAGLDQQTLLAKLAAAGFGSNQAM
ncbi:hypothetical protein OF117_11945 [Geodermatophilus sp. YIM 151500]|uniref:hypothetical protein n=1 Tax=Geodermatophilus sp. YIM 151500 TaxID=2984531 RepID=UPI0021E4CF34|nr:hypothetical protein [Geodermatophilus sp. YIM 151500]MCV2490074.1 hypothetical protein [Geodermatophilus sp. YIM 151500]